MKNRKIQIFSFIPSLKKIDKYIIRKFLGTYVFSIALIMSISLVFDINEKLDAFINNKPSLNEIIFDYYFGFVPFYVNMFGQLFVFIAVILFTSKLAANSEIIAMLSSGMSFKRLLKPYLISAFIISATSFYLAGYVIPYSSRKLIKFDHTYINPSKAVDQGSKIQLKITPRDIVYLGEYKDRNKTGINFSMDQFEGKRLVSRLTALSIKYNAGHHWTLKNFQIREFQGLEEKITKGYELDTVIPMIPQDFLIADTDAKLMKTPELYEYIKKQEARGIANIKEFKIEYHDRFSSIMAAFILAIIGASLSARKVKGGLGLNLGIGILLCMAYILFSKTASTFAVSGQMSPMLASWIPNIIFSLIAIYLLRKAPN